jgi:hypothetical protein
MRAMDREYREEELRQVRELAWSEGYGAAQYDVGNGTDTPNPYLAPTPPKRARKPRRRRRDAALKLGA